MKQLLFAFLIILGVIGNTTAQEKSITLAAIQSDVSGKSVAVPSINQILEDYTLAIGGVEAQKKIVNFFGKGTSTQKLFGAEIQGTFTLYAAAPGKYNLQTQSGWGNGIEGFTGESMWVFPSFATLKLKERDREYFNRECAFHYGIRLRELYERFEFQRIEPVEGRAAYKVKCFPKSGPIVTLFFDVETKLLVRKDGTYFNPDNEALATFFFSDYQVIQGIKFPTTIRISLANNTTEQTYHFTEIKLNAEIMDDMFRNPLQILIDRDWIDASKKQ